MSKKRKLSKEVKQWINYLKKDTNAEEWDWAIMLEMEREKLRRMADWFEKNGCHVSAEQEASRMKLAVRLISIVIDNQETIPYVNTKNMHRFIKRSELTYLSDWLNNSSTEMLPSHSMLNRAKMALSEIREEKAWYLYNKLRYYFLRQWWD